MDTVERLLMVVSGDDLGILSVGGDQWDAERTQHLADVLQKLLRSYTDAAVNFTSGLLTFISKFAVQVRAALRCAALRCAALPRTGLRCTSLAWAGCEAMRCERAAATWKGLAAGVALGED
jgi:hypothetical protein